MGIVPEFGCVVGLSFVLEFAQGVVYVMGALVEEVGVVGQVVGREKEGFGGWDPCGQVVKDAGNQR